MSHLDPDLLALLALGENVATPAELDHLRECPDCIREREQLTRAVEAARIPAVAGPLDTPHERVWAGIADKLALPRRSDPLRIVPPAAVSPVRVDVRRRSRRAVITLIAAAVVVLIAGTGGGLLLARSATETIATATLRAFPDWPGETGTAAIERRSDGERIVQVTTNLRPSDRTDHEVWLMTPGAKRLVSLGMLHGTTGSFTIPAGVKLGRFRLVDISDEPRDGNPAHSGDSIERGAFRQGA